MTLENMLSQIGTGTKQLNDRYSAEYGAPIHDQHIYYAYEPSQASQGHTASSKHHYGGGSLKSNASMSALTLLAFLFFLHILQQCIKEHMTEMSNAPVVVMSAGKEGDEALPKTAKIDKAGITDDTSTIKTEEYVKNPFRKDVQLENNMMRINAAEHKPRIDEKKYGFVYKDDTDRNAFPGFVSAMDEK